MVNAACNIEVPKTVHELEEAVHYYKTSDLQGHDLYCHWQAIRDAAIALTQPEPSSDHVPGDDSY